MKCFSVELLPKHYGLKNISQFSLFNRQMYPLVLGNLHMPSFDTRH